MAIWQYDLVAVPRTSVEAVFHCIPERIPAEIFDITRWWRAVSPPDERELDVLVPRSNSWSKSIRAWGQGDGNRIELHSDAEGLYELRVRFDLRAPSKSFVVGVIGWANKRDYVFWTDDSRILLPSLDAFLADIKNSAAFRFVQAPYDFLRSQSPDE